MQVVPSHPSPGSQQSAGRIAVTHVGFLPWQPLAGEHVPGYF